MRSRRFGLAIIFERKALAILLDRAKQAAYETVVDLLSLSLISVTKLPGGIQPAIMLDEFAECRTGGADVRQSFRRRWPSAESLTLTW